MTDKIFSDSKLTLPNISLDNAGNLFDENDVKLLDEQNNPLKFKKFLARGNSACLTFASLLECGKRNQLLVQQPLLLKEFVVVKDD